MTAARPFNFKRVCVAMLLLAAMLPRLIIPTGFMPQASASAFTIMMCGGVAPATIRLPGEQHKPDPAHDHAMKPCLFAAATSQAALDMPPPTIRSIKFATVRFNLPRRLAHLTTQRLAAPPPPSQAPPILV